MIVFGVGWRGLVWVWFCFGMLVLYMRDLFLTWVCVELGRRLWRGVWVQFWFAFVFDLWVWRGFGVDLVLTLLRDLVYVVAWVWFLVFGLAWVWCGLWCGFGFDLMRGL